MKPKRDIFSWQSCSTRMREIIFNQTKVWEQKWDCSCLCNLINSILFPCHMLHYPLHAGRFCHCRLPFFDFIPPVSFITSSHSLSHRSHLQHLLTPWVSACFWCMLSHSITNTPPHWRCQRSTPTHTADTFTGASKKLWIQQCGFFRSLILLRVRDNRWKRGIAPPCGHNTSLALMERRSFIKTHNPVPLLFCVVKRFRRLVFSTMVFLCHF